MSGSTDISLGLSSASMSLPTPLAPIQGGGVGAASDAVAAEPTLKRPVQSLAPVQPRPVLTSPPPVHGKGGGRSPAAAVRAGSGSGVRSPGARGLSTQTRRAGGTSAELDFKGGMEGHGVVGGGSSHPDAAIELAALRRSTNSREGARPTISKGGGLEGGDSMLIGVSGGGAAGSRAHSPDVSSKARKRAPLYVDDGAAGTPPSNTGGGGAVGLGFNSFSTSMSLGGRDRAAAAGRAGHHPPRGRLGQLGGASGSATSPAGQLSVSTFGHHPSSSLNIGGMVTPSRGQSPPRQGGGGGGVGATGGAQLGIRDPSSLSVSGAGGGQSPSVARGGRGGSRANAHGNAARPQRVPGVAPRRGVPSIGGGGSGPAGGPSLSLGGRAVGK